VRRSRDVGLLTEVRAGANCVLFDQEGSLWIGPGGDGLRRIADPSEIAGRRIAQFGAEAEQFTAKDGLSGDYVRAVSEDREGNIWWGTLHGRESDYLDRSGRSRKCHCGPACGPISPTVRDGRGFEIREKAALLVVQKCAARPGLGFARILTEPGLGGLCPPHSPR
jgi:hypothetical protein